MLRLLAKHRAALYQSVMHALVTGGCGFIGSHLVDRLLAGGHAVTVLDDLSTGKRTNLAARATLVEGDVADASLMIKLVAQADVVFHLAAVASVAAYADDAERCQRTNLTGTQVIFAAASVDRTPVIYASSAAVYGDSQNLPLQEASAPHPISDYGRDKRGGELAGLAAWDKHLVPNTGLRFFNVYGPRQDAASPYSGVISKFVANLRAGLPLTFFGDGEQTRDFIYVGDVVELLLRAYAEVQSAEIYNGCTGLNISLKNLAQAIGKAMNKKVETQHAPARSDDIRHSRGNPDLARERLEFIAKTALDEGLATLVADHA